MSGGRRAHKAEEPLPAEPPLAEDDFEERVVRDACGVQGNDIQYMLHVNGLCLVRLHPSHAVFTRRRDGPASMTVIFSSAVSGRSRKGFGPNMSADSTICRILDGDEVYPVVVGPAAGSLVDANATMRAENGISDDELLDALKTQYIAIFSVPRPDDED